MGLLNFDVGGLLGGVGDAAIKIRQALTGELSPEKKAEISLRLAEIEFAVVQSQSAVIIAEAKGESWLQRNWRPLLMLVIITIIANNYLLVPYLAPFTDKVKILDLPEKLWTLMEIGVGGYIVGRSAEKISKDKQ